MVQGGYNLSFRQPRYKLAMDAMVRSDLLFWRGDINARLMYDGEKHKLYGGLMYSPTISVGLIKFVCLLHGRYSSEQGQYLHLHWPQVELHYRVHFSVQFFTE